MQVAGSSRRLSAANRRCRCRYLYCELPALSGQTHCELHLLHNPAAPFRVCTVDDCSLPAPRHELPPLCTLHRRQLARCQQRRAAAPSSNSQLDGAAPPRDEWTRAQGLLQLPDSDSDSEWEAEDEADALQEMLESGPMQDDALSVLSPCDNRLRLAGVFTDEEVVLQAELRLRQLRHLYVDELGRLQLQMKQRRCRLLQEMSAGGQQAPASSATGAEKPRHRERMRACSRYRRPTGREHLLWYKRGLLRAQLAGRKLPTPASCGHLDGSQRCSQRPLPLSRYCLRHVLEEPRQLLYAVCEGEGCSTPVARMLPWSPHCQLHWQLPPTRLIQLPPELCTDPLLGLESSLNETQRRLVADVANSLLASAGQAFLTSESVTAGQAFLTPESVAAGQTFLTSESVAAGQVFLTPESAAAGQSFLTSESVAAGQTFLTPESVAAGQALVTPESVAAGQALVTPESVADDTELTRLMPPPSSAGLIQRAEDRHQQPDVPYTSMCDAVVCTDVQPCRTTCSSSGHQPDTAVGQEQLTPTDDPASLPSQPVLSTTTGPAVVPLPHTTEANVPDTQLGPSSQVL